MKSVVNVLVPLLIAGSVLSVSAQKKDPGLHLSHPESVNSDNKFLYVTDLGKELNLFVKDGDGAISKLSLDGKVLKKNLSKEVLNTPRGTAIINGVIYVTDMDRIVGIQISTGNKVMELDFSATKTNFLNDLEVRDNHTLFVSATDLGKVFEVDLSGKPSFKPLLPEVTGANGLSYDRIHKRLYVNTIDFKEMKKGVVGVIDFSKSPISYNLVADLNGAFDGLALTNDHTLLVSDWVDVNNAAGVIKQINLKTRTVKKIQTRSSLAGPSDFYYDKKHHQIYVPMMLTGEVLRYKL